MKTAIKRILILIKWLALMVFAMAVLLLSPLAYIIGLFDIFINRKLGKSIDKLAASFKSIAYALDVAGCASIFNWLWFLFKTKNGYQFGHCGETISYVLRRNYETKTLKPFGMWLYKSINKIDKGHFDNL